MKRAEVRSVSESFINQDGRPTTLGIVQSPEAQYLQSDTMISIRY